MSRTIERYELKPAVSQSIVMPRDAEILCVGVRGITMYLWAEIVAERHSQMRHFEIYEAGHNIDPNVQRKYIGTAFLPQPVGNVMHIFEKFDD